MVSVLTPPIPTALIALFPNVSVLMVVSAPSVVLPKLVAPLALNITFVALSIGSVAVVVPAKSVVTLLRLLFQTPSVAPFQ